MSKNKKNLIIFGIVIVLLLILAVICILKSRTKNNTLNLYKKISNSPKFTFSIEEQNYEETYKLVMSKRENDVSIDMYSGDEHTSTLVLNNNAYYITHNQQEYFDYGVDDTETDIVISALDNITKKQYTSGREKINNKEYYYEEFDNEYGDFVILISASEDTDIKTRFYFDGNKIAYIKNLISTDDGIEEELLKVDLKYEVDENLFQVPEGYSEIEYDDSIF